MTARYFRMTEIHQRIDRNLRDELRNRLPDELRVSRLKQMKCRAKTMLRRLRPQPV